MKLNVVSDNKILLQLEKIEMNIAWYKVVVTGQSARNPTLNSPAVVLKFISQR